MIHQNVLFIGGGHMTSGIIQTLLDHQFLSRSRIHVIGRSRKHLSSLAARFGINVYVSGDPGIPPCRCVILAVPPQQAASAIRANEAVIPADTLLISVCAGITIDAIQSMFSEGSPHPVIRVMPNTLGVSGYGLNAICAGTGVSKDETAFAKDLFQPLGDTLFLPEERFNAFTAFSCSGPAYVLAFIQTMIEAGVECGFSEDESRRIVLENLSGTSETITRSGALPSEILSRMATPGGITETAVNVLAEEGFDLLLKRAVRSGVSRADELTI